MNPRACWRPVAGGIELAVKVTPKAGKKAVEGVVTDAAGQPWLALKVTPPADAGKANRAVLALLAEALDVPASHVTLTAGAGARLKRITVAGDPAALAAKVETVLAPTAQRLPRCRKG